MFGIPTNIESRENRQVIRLYGQRERPKYQTPSRVEIRGKKGALSLQLDNSQECLSRTYYDTGHHDVERVVRYAGYDTTDMMSSTSVSTNRIYSRGKFPSKSGQEYVFPFKQLRQKIAGFSKLPNNWDGDGADAPNSVSISNAQFILTILEQLRLLPSCVTPSVENGIAISFIKLSKYSDMECFNSGEVLAVMSDGNGSPDVWELQAGNQEIELAAQKIREFLQ